MLPPRRSKARRIWTTPRPKRASSSVGASSSRFCSAFSPSVSFPSTRYFSASGWAAAGAADSWRTSTAPAMMDSRHMIGLLFLCRPLPHGDGFSRRQVPRLLSPLGEFARVTFLTVLCLIPVLVSGLAMLEDELFILADCGRAVADRLP